jgi:hypothetical protein
MRISRHIRRTSLKALTLLQRIISVADCIIIIFTCFGTATNFRYLMIFLRVHFLKTGSVEFVMSSVCLAVIDIFQLIL